MAAGTVVVHVVDEAAEEPFTVEQKPSAPPVRLIREEQIAFVEFGKRHQRLSAERQSEVVSCFDEVKGDADDSRVFALGISSYLQQNEG